MIQEIILNGIIASDIIDTVNSLNIFASAVLLFIVNALVLKLVFQMILD